MSVSTTSPLKVLQGGLRPAFSGPAFSEGGVPQSTPTPVSAAPAFARSLPTAHQMLATLPNVRFAGTKYGDFEVALSPEDRRDIIDNKMAEIVLDPPTSTYAQLSQGNKKALAHLVKAAKILDSVWLEQDHPDNLAAKAALETAVADTAQKLDAAKASGNKAEIKAAEAAQQEADDMMTLFTSFNGIEGKELYGADVTPFPLFKDRPQGPGKGVYPADLSADELKAYIFAHPEDAAGIFSNNTIVQRDGDRLIGVPYSIAFRNQYRDAAKHLLKAARLCTSKQLRTYLQWQAQAMVNESDPEMMYNADKTWIDMEDTPLEFTIGRESYDDRLASQLLNDPDVVSFLEKNGIHPKKKDFLGIRVGIVNRDSYSTIAGYRAELQGYAKEMPGASEYKQSVDNGDGGNKMTFADVDLVALTGDYPAARGGLTIAQNLPNDDKLAVKLNCGSRLAFHRQIRQSGDPAQRKKFLDALVDPEQHPWYDPESDFLFTIGHELSHSLGPLHTDKGGDVISSLGDYGALLEEEKADISSIVMTDYFVKIGKFTPEEANKIYLSWAADELPMAKPSLDQAHRVRSIMQLNSLIEKGAIHFEAGGKLRIDPDRMGSAARELLGEIIDLQRAGDPAKARAFVDKYFQWTPAMQYSREQQLALKPKRYKVVRQPLADVLLKQVKD